MDNDIDPITGMALDYGCKSCGNQTDKFYFIHYYILPSRLVRKRHRDKNRCAVYCCSCYEAQEELDFEINGNRSVVSKKNKIDINASQCFICGSKIHYEALHGLLTILHLMHGSGIESKPLAFFCSKCAEEHTIEL